jgi:hypothetical protein
MTITHFGCKKKATKFKIVQTLKLNHTAQAKSVRPVFITGQIGLAAVLSPKQRGLLYQRQDKVFRKQVRGKKINACPR